MSEGFDREALRVIVRLCDTVDAAEAERDALRAAVESWVDTIGAWDDEQRMPDPGELADLRDAMNNRAASRLSQEGTK